MIDEITKFFNDKPIIAILLVLILSLLLYFIMQKNEMFEHMDSTPTTNNYLPKCTINSDQEFNAQYVGQSKIINFKCTIGDIDYYLACVKMTDYQVTNPDKTADCANSMLILIPATEINSMLENYLKDMATAEKICNSTLQIKCHDTPSLVSPASPASPTSSDSPTSSECPATYPACQQTRLFLHDFNVVDVTPVTSDSMILRKYVIKGTALPSLNGQSSPTMFNNFLYNENGINMVCGDTYAYGSPNIPKQYAEVVISETNVANIGGVIGSTSILKTKIRFNTLQQIITTTNGIQKKIPIIDQCTGEIKTKPVYMGVCTAAQSCAKGNNKYPRVCVYDDIMNPNVLEFQPHVVSF
jgi:hypothetical protein